MKKKTIEAGEKFVSGLSDCCEAPLKEVGSGLTILFCSDCGQMCNKKHEDKDDDDFPDDFFDED